MFSSKDKKHSNKQQHTISSAHKQKTNEKTQRAKHSSLSHVEQFNHYKNQIAVCIPKLEDQINILKSYYQSSQKPFISSTEKNQLHAAISQKIDDIYKIGNDIRNTFTKANPDILFNNSNLSVETIAQYQFIYDNLYTSFKTVWIDLYHSKEQHAAYELGISKQFLKIRYPDASQEQISTAASLMMEDDTLSKMTSLMNVTDFLRYAQQRHQEIIKIEKSLHEVHQLFIDMMVLTNNQGETIDHILQNVQSSKQKVKESINDLSDAKHGLEKRSFGFNK